MSRMLVTGGTGYIGSCLVRALLQLGNETHVLVRPSSRVANLDGAVVHVWDGSYASLDNIVGHARPDCTFHLASLFLASHTAADIDPLMDSNLKLGTLLLESLSHHGCHRLVSTGTSWQHYDDAEHNPVCLYAATKQAFEDIARYYAEGASQRIVHLHLSDTYGPHDPRRKILQLLVNAALSAGRLSMSPGEQLLDLVYIDDVVSAFLRASEIVCSDEYNALPPAVYSVSSGAPLSLRALVDHVERVAKATVDVTWGGRPYRPREVMQPWSTGTWPPGWKPRVGLVDGLAAVVRAIRDKE